VLFRSEVQMIGISQYDAGVDVLLQLPLVHCFDGAGGAYRHEDGRGYIAMIGADYTHTGAGLLIPV